MMEYENGTIAARLHRSKRHNSSQKSEMSEMSEKKSKRKERSNSKKKINSNAKTKNGNENGNSKMDSTQYYVESILTHRVNRINGETEYLIKWEGYNNRYNSWNKEIDTPQICIDQYWQKLENNKNEKNSKNEKKEKSKKKKRERKKDGKIKENVKNDSVRSRRNKGNDKWNEKWNDKWNDNKSDYSFEMIERSEPPLSDDDQFVEKLKQIKKSKEKKKRKLTNSYIIFDGEFQQAPLKKKQRLNENDQSDKSNKSNKSDKGNKSNMHVGLMPKSKNHSKREKRFSSLELNDHPIDVWPEYKTPQISKKISKTMSSNDKNFQIKSEIRRRHSDISYVSRLIKEENNDNHNGNQHNGDTTDEKQERLQQIRNSVKKKSQFAKLRRSLSMINYHVVASTANSNNTDSIDNSENIINNNNNNKHDSNDMNDMNDMNDSNQQFEKTDIEMYFDSQFSNM